MKTAGSIFDKKAKYHSTAGDIRTKVSERVMLERGFLKCLKYKRNNIVSQSYFEFGISELRGIAGTGFYHNATRRISLRINSKTIHWPFSNFHPIWKPQGQFLTKKQNIIPQQVIFEPKCLKVKWICLRFSPELIRCYEIHLKPEYHLIKSCGHS